MSAGDEERQRMSFGPNGGSDAAPLKFGMFDWIDNSGADVADIYEQRLKMLELADEAGFYCYHLAEHQLTPLSLAPSPGIFLSAAIQRTRRLHIGPMGYLVPLSPNPADRRDLHARPVEPRPPGDRGRPRHLLP